MNTPIAEFVRFYAASDTARLHMPGHKGVPRLGCEPLDITEIQGADALYEASGIIAESEQNAAALFGSAATFYATEGSSQCVRAMLALAVWQYAARFPAQRPVVVAGRNAHKSFLYAAALLDFDVVWLWPEDTASICACRVTPQALEAALNGLPCPPAAVYLTSPDYLGGQCELAALAALAHRYGAPLLVDNAHGAYLRFLAPSRHPLQLGADACCDSAHKTLSVLTGGAYLHVSACAPALFRENGKRALALFGSTSPSYLILQSLDLCNLDLAGDYPQRLAETAARLDALRASLRVRGWTVMDTDPLKLTLDCAASGCTGRALAARLRTNGLECEYCDEDDLVLMFTPENSPADFTRLAGCLSEGPSGPARARQSLPVLQPEAVCTIRQAMFAPHTLLPAEQAAGRVCGAPTVSCPPAVPIAVSGERIDAALLPVFRRYGVSTVEVLDTPAEMCYT